mmetsp:Transcript_14902/g.36579  ORF Transcript_14902/g.36579 Transcript_14902/m.36579 type:complete len:203 (+) Transcript_14902:2015-2623(+)
MVEDHCGRHLRRVPSPLRLVSGGGASGGVIRCTSPLPAVQRVAPLLERADLHPRHLPEEQPHRLRVHHGGHAEVHVEAHHTLVRVGARRELPSAHQPLEEARAAVGSRYGLRGDRLFVHQRHVGDVLFVEEPEADFQLGFKVLSGIPPHDARARAERHEFVILPHVGHHREQVLGRVLHRLGRRERPSAHLVKVGQREKVPR